ncbi:MAG: RNB domain-containing ribonuclease [Deltaproteobacteria bacterium]|nr:RNB domain-containing ribonuclease [Deltaproteobacteria bacterium]
MFQPGDVVEFLENNQFIVALCLDVKKEKPRLLTQANREIVLSARRLIDAGGPTLQPNRPRQELLDVLNDLAARREGLKKGIDLPEVWSLVLEDETEAPYPPDFLAGLIFGEPVEPDQISALLRAVIEDKVYFRFRQEGLLVTPAQRVEQLLVQRARQEEIDQENEAVGCWLDQVWRGAEADPPKQAEKVIERLVDVAVNGADSPHSNRVKGYLEAAGTRGSQAAFQLLVKLGRFSPDENLNLRRLKIPLSFPETVQAETEELARQAAAPREWPDREDLTGLETFTIDGDYTLDFDDALSFEVEGEKRIVHVHITDTTPFIAPHSALDREAGARVSSLYLTDQRLPMLPPALSEDLLPLKEGALRPAFSLRVELDEGGKVLNQRLSKSLVRVSRRLTYGEVDQDLKNDPRMSHLVQLTRRLQERRQEGGAMILDVPEIMIRLQEDHIVLDRIEEPTSARMLVAELMILANGLAAQGLSQAGIPAVFRSQEPPAERFKAPPGADPLWVTLRQRMHFNPLALYPAPAPHAGLGLEAYVTFTSPIRRYLDLITLRQLPGLIEGGQPFYNQGAIEEIIEAVSPVLRAHNQVRFRRQRYWLLKYLAQEKDRVCEAVVLDRVSDRFRLVLLETMLRAPSPKLPPTALVPGQRVDLRVKKVDPAEDILRLEIA